MSDDNFIEPNKRDLRLASFILENFLGKTDLRHLNVLTGRMNNNPLVQEIVKFRLESEAFSETHPSFVRNQLVKRKTGNWHGKIVGTYSTEHTPEGYCVQSILEKDAVHVEPVRTLELWDGTLPQYIFDLIGLNEE